MVRLLAKNDLLEGMPFFRKIPLWRNLFAVLLLALFLCGSWVSCEAALAQEAGHAEELNNGAILHHLNLVINWYRDTTAKVQAPGQPSDAIYQSNAQSLAAKVVQLAFQSAKAEATLISAPPKQGSSVSGAGAASQNIEQRLNDVKAQISQFQSQAADLDSQITKASRSKLKALTAQKDAIAGELDLYKAEQRVLEQVVESSNANGELAAGGLLASIDQLERTVPEAAGGDQAASKAAAAKQSSQSAPNGLFGQAELLYEQLESMR